MYCLATCVYNHMLSHISDPKTPKEAWENLEKILATNTSAHKLQLRQELNNIKQKEIFVSDYTAKVKSICDSLGSINVNINEDKMVQVCAGGLAQQFNPLRMVILARETPPSFFNVQSMLLVEENHIQTKTNTSEGQMFFSESDGGRRRGRRGRGRFDLSQRNLRKKGELPRQKRSANHATYVQLLRKTRPSQRGVPKKKKQVGFNKPETHKLRRERGICGYGGPFVMRHGANSMMASNSANSASTSNSEHAWFVDSGASHHMTSH